jgi:hypothetical protein
MRSYNFSEIGPHARTTKQLSPGAFKLCAGHGYCLFNNASTLDPTLEHPNQSFQKLLSKAQEPFLGNRTPRNKNHINVSRCFWAMSGHGYCLFKNFRTLDLTLEHPNQCFQKLSSHPQEQFHRNRTPRNKNHINVSIRLWHMQGHVYSQFTQF